VDWGYAGRVGWTSQGSILAFTCSLAGEQALVSRISWAFALRHWSLEPGLRIFDDCCKSWDIVVSSVKVMLG
jgi:hypothetical protein